MGRSGALLSIENVTVRLTHRPAPAGWWQSAAQGNAHGPTPAPALRDVSLAIPPAKVVGLVGEQGSGKTVTALAILGLLDGAQVSGRILLGGQDLLALSERELRAVRGKRVAMVFQDPMNALNPVLTAGAQVAEALRVHERLGRRLAAARAVELLRLVGIAAPEERARAFPHELSPGTRQRVTIAVALACRPELLIADEPTTALDVTVQAQILSLLKRLGAELGMSVLLITHDLGVVVQTCDLVYVMHQGRIVEQGEAAAVFARPRHPATLRLLASNAATRGDTPPTSSA